MVARTAGQPLAIQLLLPETHSAGPVGLVQDRELASGYDSHLVRTVSYHRVLLVRSSMDPVDFQAKRNELP